MASQKFPSYMIVLLFTISLLCTGVDQPGFTRGCNYLLPVDITVKLDRANAADSLSMAKKVQKLRKPAAKGSSYRQLLTSVLLYHHHHGRVAGEGCRVVAPPCPRSTTCLQRSPVRRVELIRSWSSHLFRGRPGRRRHVRSGGRLSDKFTWTEEPSCILSRND